MTWDLRNKDEVGRMKDETAALSQRATKLKELDQQAAVVRAHQLTSELMQPRPRIGRCFARRHRRRRRGFDRRFRWRGSLSRLGHVNLLSCRATPASPSSGCWE